MWKRLGLSLLSLGVLFAVLTVLLPWHHVLTITSPKKGKVVLCAEMGEGEEFVLSFVHSVNKRPVYDTLKVEGNHLVIVKSRFDSFGAGMPETSTEEGTLQFDPDGWLVWTVNRPVAEVTIFVGRVANHRLQLRGWDLALADLAEPGTPLTLKTDKTSFYQIWKGRCLR